MKLFEAALAASLFWLRSSGLRMFHSAPVCVLKELPFTFQCELHDIDIANVQSVAINTMANHRVIAVTQCTMNESQYELSTYGKQFFAEILSQCNFSNWMQQGYIGMNFTFTPGNNWRASLDIVKIIYCSAEARSHSHPHIKSSSASLDEYRNVQLCEVSVNLFKLSNVTWLGAKQRITCIVNGNYSSVEDVNPIILKVSCPHGHCKYRDEKNESSRSVTFEATWLWNDAEVFCRLGRSLSSPYFDRLKVKVTDVPALQLTGVGQHFWIGTEQRIKCQAIGSYDIISTIYPIKWNVPCSVVSNCNYSTKNFNDGAMLTFFATELWNNSVVKCRLNMDTEPNASLTVVVVDYPRISIVSKPLGYPTYSPVSLKCLASAVLTASELAWDVVGCQRCLSLSAQTEINIEDGRIASRLEFIVEAVWSNQTLRCYSPENPFLEDFHTIPNLRASQDYRAEYLRVMGTLMAVVIALMLFLWVFMITYSKSMHRRTKSARSHRRSSDRPPATAVEPAGRTRCQFAFGASCNPVATTKAVTARITSDYNRARLHD